MTGAEEQELGGWTNWVEGRTAWTDRWEDHVARRTGCTDGVMDWLGGLGRRTGRKEGLGGRRDWVKGRTGLMAQADARTGWMDQQAIQ